VNQRDHRDAKARSYGFEIGTFNDPIPAGTTVCPGCGEPRLRAVEYGLLEVALVGFLEPEDQALVKSRVEVRCTSCPWFGSMWRGAKGAAA
jgi:hypothetical protein